jgi:hypothetical protein
VLYFIAWMIALATYERGNVEPTDWMRPIDWTGLLGPGGGPRPGGR